MESQERELFQQLFAPHNRRDFYQARRRSWAFGKCIDSISGSMWK